jgi:hypothetical protein
MKPTARKNEQKPFWFYRCDASLFLIFSAKSEIRNALPGKSSAKRNPMRRIGSHSFALAAANAWSSERPGGGRVVCAAQAAILFATGLTRPGSIATD